MQLVRVCQGIHDRKVCFLLGRTRGGVGAGIYTQGGMYSATWTRGKLGKLVLKLLSL